jgi:hypothetical protein
MNSMISNETDNGTDIGTDMGFLQLYFNPEDI